MSEKSLLRVGYALLLMLWVCAGVSAQTLIVDQSLGSTDDTHFTSLKAAIMSFDWVTSMTTGIHANDPAPNIINITGFGPYDEELPVLFVTSNVTADAKCKLKAGDTTVTVQGSGVEPLILARFIASDNAAIIATDSSTYQFNQVIIAPSPTDTPTQRLLDALQTGKIQVNDSVVCCLPASSVSYTSSTDIPSGILDATRPFDDSYIGCTTPGATTGMAAQASNAGTITFTDTYITQFGTASTAGVTLCAFQNGLIQLNQGTVLRNNAGGVYTRHNDATNKSKFIIRGQPGNRVTIGQNNPWGNGWLDLRLFSYAEVSHCNFVGQPTNSALSIGSNNASLGELHITDCIFAEGNPANNNTAAIRIAAKPTIYSVDRISILNHGVGYQYYSNGSALVTTLTDSIIAGCFSALGNSTVAGGTVNADYCGFPASGPHANTALTQSASVTVNETATVNADPQFTSVLSTDSGFAEVNNPAYGGKASDGSHLVGGGSASASVPVEMSAFALE